jgi:broad specificity phosphatase PhoE
MAGKIHLIRHAESVHNVDKDFSRIDPQLTSLGKEQASALSKSFPHLKDVGLIISSPLSRTIQTTLLAFPGVLDKKYYGIGSEQGVEGGVDLVLDPYLQERSALGCDTGSEREVLEGEFPGLHEEITGLEEGWTKKGGIFGVDDETVERRAQKVRDTLRRRILELEKRERRDIIVVTHGVFMKFLSEDKEIDLPKAGWKTYTVETDGKDNSAVLVPV